MLLHMVCGMGSQMSRVPSEIIITDFVSAMHCAQTPQSADGNVSHIHMNKNVDLFHHGKETRFWVDPMGCVHECFQAVKFQSHSSSCMFRSHGGGNLLCFTTPAIVRMEFDGQTRIYCAVAITVDDVIGASTSKAPSIFNRMRVVLHSSRDSNESESIHHPQMHDLLPPDDATLASPLPAWCTALHAAFLEKALKSRADADSDVAAYKADQLARASTAERAGAAAAANATTINRQLRSLSANTPTALAARLDGVAADVSSARSALDTLTTSNTKHHSALSTLDTRVSNLEVRMTILEKNADDGRKAAGKGATKADAAKRAPVITAAALKKLVTAAVTAELDARAKAGEEEEDDEEDSDEDESKRRKVQSGHEEHLVKENAALIATINKLIAPPSQPPAPQLPTPFSLPATFSQQQPVYWSGNVPPALGGMVGGMAGLPSVPPASAEITALRARLSVYEDQEHQ